MKDKISVIKRDDRTYYLSFYGAPEGKTYRNFSGVMYDLIQYMKKNGGYEILEQEPVTSGLSSLEERVIFGLRDLLIR